MAFAQGYSESNPNLTLSLLSLSDVASKQQQIPIPPASPGFHQGPAPVPIPTKETKHRRLNSTGQSRRRLSDARDAAVRPSPAQLATSPPPPLSAAVTSQPRVLGLLSNSVPVDSAFPASMTQGIAENVEIPSNHNSRDKSVGASSVGDTAGSSSQSTSGAKKKGTIFRCESCSKVYRHPSCLVKHRWEHSPQWREASKFLLSKHQQVQLLEAAAILSHLAPGTSLPEDRSLWPSYLSGGLLPTPEPIAIPNTRSAGVGALAALGGGSSSSTAFAARQAADSAWAGAEGRQHGTASSLPSSSPPFASSGLTESLRSRGRTVASQSSSTSLSKTRTSKSRGKSAIPIDGVSGQGESDDLEMEMEMGGEDEDEYSNEQGIQKEEIEPKFGRGMRKRSGKLAATGSGTPTRRQEVSTPTGNNRANPRSAARASLQRGDRDMSLDIDADEAEEASGEDGTDDSDGDVVEPSYYKEAYPGGGFSNDNGLVHAYPVMIPLQHASSQSVPTPTTYAPSSNGNGRDSSGSGISLSSHLASVSAHVPGLGVVIGSNGQPSGPGTSQAINGASHPLAVPARPATDPWTAVRETNSYSSSHSFSPSPHSLTFPHNHHFPHQQSSDGALPFSHSASPSVSSLHSHYTHSGSHHSSIGQYHSHSIDFRFDPSLSHSSYEPSLSTSLSSSVGLPRSSIRSGSNEDEEDEKDQDEEDGIIDIARDPYDHIALGGRGDRIDEDAGDGWGGMEMEMDF